VLPALFVVVLDNAMPSTPKDISESLLLGRSGAR
jgi:hypothetical protein